MDGNSLEQKLVPEIGQTEQPASDPAPAASPAPGQGTQEPPAADQTGGHGEPQPLDPEEMIPMSRYKELQSIFTKKSMELAQLKRQPAQAEPQPAPQPPAQPNSLAAMVQQLVQDGIAQAVAPIQQQQQDLRIQAKIMELSGNKDFGDVAQTFVDMLEENPELLDLENGKGLDLAYKAARASVLEKSITAKAQAAAIASGQVTAAKLLNNDTTPNVKPATAAAPPSDADAIKRSIMEVGRKSSIF